MSLEELMKIAGLRHYHASEILILQQWTLAFAGVTCHQLSGRRDNLRFSMTSYTRAVS